MMKNKNGKNYLNFLIMLSVAVPILLSGYRVMDKDFCSSAKLNLRIKNISELKIGRDSFCLLGLIYPQLFVNIVFFFNVCVLFWLISLFQNSTWLIDPYWTFIPPMIGFFYLYHPLGSRSPLRATLTYTLVLAWSVRLTCSYFRREQWQMGAREDWRFADKRKAYGKNWWWISFFYAYLSQQPMLVGLCLPLYAINFEQTPTQFQPYEGIFLLLCLLGLVIAHCADTQLHCFMQENVKREKAGIPKVLLLETGLWKYSRHPNYFGEQLWWWSLAGFACACGDYWTLVGPLFNSLVMAAVTGSGVKEELQQRVHLRSPTKIVYHHDHHDHLQNNIACHKASNQSFEYWSSASSAWAVHDALDCYRCSSSSTLASTSFLSIIIINV